VFVVVDGRSEGYSAGVTMTELAQIMVDLGALPEKVTALVHGLN